MPPRYETTNEGRAARGMDTIDHYMDQHQDYEDGLIRSQEALIDLLTDLRHAAEEDGLDVDAALIMSEIHFREERS